MSVMTETEAKDYNYIDQLKTTAQREYYTEQLDTDIQRTGRWTYIFKLDKSKTDTNVYGDAKHGRIYLPHFEQRALYTSQLWNGELTLNLYEEKMTDNIELTYSFDRMVHNLRNLKNTVSGKLSVKNIYDNSILFIISNDKIIIKDAYNNSMIEKNLSDYSNINLLIDSINSNTSSNIVLSYTGDTEPASNISDTEFVLMSNHTKYVEVKDRTYEKCSDVIELGDIIMDDKYNIYSVVYSAPSNDQINDYISWTIKGSRLDMSIVDSLPNDYRVIIDKNRYGLPKINME